MWSEHLAVSETKRSGVKNNDEVVGIDQSAPKTCARSQSDDEQVSGRAAGRRSAGQFELPVRMRSQPVRRSEKTIDGVVGTSQDAWCSLPSRPAQATMFVDPRLRRSTTFVSWNEPNTGHARYESTGAAHLKCCGEGFTVTVTNIPHHR